MKILILDDHALFRDGLNYMLQSIAPEINLIEAATVDSAVALIQEHDDISLALIDLDMPVQDGFDALTLFTSNFATLPCVILSASTKRSDVTKALDLGAVGFISKNS